MHRVVRTRTVALTSTVLFSCMATVAAQLVISGAGTSPPPGHSQRAALAEPAAAMAAIVVRPVTPAPVQPEPAPAPAPTTTPTTTPAPATTPAAVAAAPAPAATDPSMVPPIGQATAWGCGAALAYLQAYAAKGFALECPGYAEGEEAMTCLKEAGACPTSGVIAIADPCPQAYMNEASNSYVVTGVSDSPIDPYGPCP